MKSKKGDITFLTVIILVSIVSFGVITVYFVGNSNLIATELDDVGCRALIVGKSNTLAKIGQFFYEINNKCVKEEIINNYQSNEELFDDVGDNMQRCWYRYGEGQHDFLSNYDTQGRWCMLCGTIESSNDIGEFNLAEFVDWTEKDENAIQLKNGSKGKYLDYVNFKYFDDQSNQLLDIAETLETLDKTDPTDKLFAEIFEEQYQGLVDLNLKKITTYENQKNYIVYRFDRIDTDLDDQVTNALIGAGTGIALGIATSTIIENALIWGGTTIICTASIVTGPGAVVLCGGAVAAATVTTAKTGVKVASAANKISRLSKLAEKMSSLVIFTKSSKTNKIQKLVKTFDGSLDDALLVSKELDKLDPELAGEYLRYANKLNDLGIDDFGKIDELILDVDKNKDILYKIFDNSVELNRMTDTKITKYIEKESSLTLQSKKLKNIQTELIPLVQKGGDLNEPQKLKLVEYIRGTPALLGGVTGAYVGTNLNFDSRQYVDVMTQEEYYRLCGTERQVIDN
jgi:hypothetical protein